MNIKNLLEETKEILAEHNLTIEDIKWVGCASNDTFHWSCTSFSDIHPDTYEIPVEVFCMLASQDYDSSHGSTEVRESLVVVGDDWWLERAEYDGSEWWEFKTMPIRPKEVRYDAKIFYDDNLN